MSQTAGSVVPAAPGAGTGGGTDPADRGELRRALLTRPLAAAAAGGVVVAVVAAAVDGHRLAAAVSALLATAVVLATSAVTGLLGVRTAAARAEAVFAAAMASFAVKVLVFGIALGVAGHVGSARRVPFALGAIVAVLVWLAVEVAAVSRMRSTGSAVFGPPPARTGPAEPPGDVTRQVPQELPQEVPGAVLGEPRGDDRV